MISIILTTPSAYLACSKTSQIEWWNTYLIRLPFIIIVGWDSIALICSIHIYKRKRCHFYLVQTLFLLNQDNSMPWHTHFGTIITIFSRSLYYTNVCVFCGHCFFPFKGYQYTGSLFYVVHGKVANQIICRKFCGWIVLVIHILLYGWQKFMCFITTFTLIKF